MLETNVTPGEGCTCEARIVASVLDGYACGKQDCWRTPVAKASFDAFAAELVARRAVTVSGEGSASRSASPSNNDEDRSR